MLSALTKFLRRSGPQRWLLLRAALSLAVMRLAVRLPFRTVSRVMGLRQGETPETLDPAMRAQAAAVGWAVRAAASHAPWESTCLVQALAGAALLRHRRIDGTLYLGVAKDAAAAESMSAHAWLRCGDLVLTGGAERARFTPIASFASGRTDGQGRVGWGGRRFEDRG